MGLDSSWENFFHGIEIKITETKLECDSLSVYLLYAFPPLDNVNRKRLLGWQLVMVQ